MDGRKNFSSELALLTATVVNSFAVALIVKADFGISTLTSVPLILSYIFDFLSFGWWNFIFQVLFLTVLILVTRNPDPRYILSFVVAKIFGSLLDVFAQVVAPLPPHFAFRVLYFAVGFLIMVPGIVLYLRCRLPPLPFDAFVRDIATHFGLSIKWVRTPLDVVCVGATVAVSLIALGTVRAVGVGTVITALTLGPALGLCCRWMDDRFVFAPSFAASMRLCK